MRSPPPASGPRLAAPIPPPPPAATAPPLPLDPPAQPASQSNGKTPLAEKNGTRKFCFFSNLTSPTIEFDTKSLIVIFFRKGNLKDSSFIHGFSHTI